MYDLIPVNKYVTIDPIKENEKVGDSGILFAPGNALEKQHRMGRIIAKDDCDEAKRFNVGDIVFYDHIGAVSGRAGNQGFTVVKAVNVMMVVRQMPQRDTISGVDPNGLI